MQVYDLDDLEPVTIQFDENESMGNKVPSNIGNGIELLMNTKKISNSTKRNVHLGEVGEVEDEINKIYNKPIESNTLGGFANNLFNFSNNNNNNNTDNINVNVNDNSSLGSATSNSVHGINKSHDGFSKMNDIPVEFSKYNVISDRDKTLKKKKMMRELSKNSNFQCNQDSSYEDVEDEYNTHIEDKRKDSSVKFQRMWFTTIISSVELFNGLYDPFNISLDGLSDSINDNIDSYDESFGELYVKYNGIKLAPEISILLRLGFTIGTVIFVNRQLNSVPSDMSNIIKQSPVLMKEFAKTATNVATDGYMNSLNMSSSYGPPPKPIETKLPPPSERIMPKSSSRPDIQHSRGPMFHEEGIDIIRDRDHDINQTTNFFQSSNPISRPSSNQRYEMKGPNDIDFSDFLTGIKTKKNTAIEENDSLISVTSMKDMLNQSKPNKRSNRRKVSERNTISLDI